MQSKPTTDSTSERKLYEYAVIRYVPRVEREEFVNIGLLMMCKRRRWIRARVEIDDMRVLALFGEADLETLRRQVQSFVEIAKGKSVSPISELETHERFRWLTAVRSASIATSRPHPGLCTDLDREFDRLFSELVE